MAVMVLAIFLVHALVAMWKLPGSYREYRAFWIHMRGLRHGDTSLWIVQVVSGQMWLLDLVLIFAAYVKIGLEHRPNAGERYVPSWQQPTPAGDH